MVDYIFDNNYINLLPRPIGRNANEKNDSR